MTIQDELPIEEPETGARLTEADVTDALQRRYGAVWGNGQRYACAAQVRSRAGFDARRTADFVAMDLWPSKGLVLHGHEVKVSRSDWLRELKEPEKAAEFIPYMNHWWVVASGPRIVRPGELPEEWGLMVMRGTDLAVTKAAPKREAKPMTPSRLAALLRAVAQTSGYLERREHERRYRCHSRHCPQCGALVRYMGFCRCTGCGCRVELGDLATAEDATRIRAERDRA